MGRLLSLVSGWQGYAATAALCFLAGSAGTWRVMSWREQAHQTQKAEQTVRLVVHEGQIITDLGFVYVPRFYAIQQEAQNHIAEIPEHVTPKIDADYPVPLGFVRVWNIDANGPVPAAAAGSDADPSGVKLSTVAVEHAIDTGTLETCRTALTEWWDWYDRNLKAWPK